MILTFTLHGRPLRGKSGQRKTRTGKQYPDAAWGKQRDEWAMVVEVDAMEQIRRMKKDGWTVKPLPLTCSVKLSGVIHYPDNRIADLDGVCGAIAHVLERAGLIANDKQIEAYGSWDRGVNVAGGMIRLTLQTEWVKGI